MTLPLSVLAERAADLVERGWCRVFLAEDANGDIAEACGPSACKWCLIGAIYRVCPTRESRFGLQRAVRAELGLGNTRANAVADWNDAPGRTQSEVVGVLRRVARELERKGV